VVMIILVSILVGWGWSWQVSWKSLIIALMILLSLYQLSATRRAGFLEKKQSNEFFSNSPLVTNGGELTKNLKQYSQKLEGKQVLKDVSVFTPYPPSLKWALRDLSNVKFVNALDPNALPAFVISFSDEKNLSAGDYRGESLVWQQTIEWENMKWYEWGNWLAFRKVPVSLQRVILWMRVDLFPADYLWSN
jgi:hypothetical protein